MQIHIDGILKELKKKLQDSYRGRLHRLILFGSYARNDQQPQSDVDLAAVLDDFSDIGAEIESVSNLISQVSLAHNIVVSFHPIREKDFNNRRTPFLLNLKREGITI